MRALRKRGTNEIFPWAPVLAEREDMEEGAFEPASGVFASSEATVRPDPEKPKRARAKKEPDPPANPLELTESPSGAMAGDEGEELLEEEGAD